MRPLAIDNEVFTNHGFHWSIGYGISVGNASDAHNTIYDNDRGIDVAGGTATETVSITTATPAFRPAVQASCKAIRSIKI